MATVLGYLEYNENNLGGGRWLLVPKGQICFFSEPSLRSDFFNEKQIDWSNVMGFFNEKQQHLKKKS